MLQIVRHADGKSYLLNGVYRYAVNLGMLCILLIDPKLTFSTVTHPRIVASTGAHGMADSKDGCMIVEGISVNADKTRKESRGRAQVKES